MTKSHDSVHDVEACTELIMEAINASPAANYSPGIVVTALMWVIKETSDAWGMTNDEFAAYLEEHAALFRKRLASVS